MCRLRRCRSGEAMREMNEMVRKETGKPIFCSPDNSTMPACQSVPLRRQEASRHDDGGCGLRGHHDLDGSGEVEHDEIAWGSFAAMLTHNDLGLSASMRTQDDVVERLCRGEPLGPIDDLRWALVDGQDDITEMMIAKECRDRDDRVFYELAFEQRRQAVQPRSPTSRVLRNAGEAVF